MLSPIVNATIKLPNPEKVPLITTISMELLLLIILVQLFSKPQQTQARRINKEPKEKVKLVIFSTESKKHDAVTKNMPAHKRGLIFSLKSISAMIAVATISKLLSKDALAAVADFEMKRVCGRNADSIVMVYDRPSFDVMRPTPYFDYRIEAEGATIRDVFQRFAFCSFSAPVLGLYESILAY